MKIVMVTTNDPAGTAITLCKLLNTYTEHSCRLVTTETRYNFAYEKDLHVPWLDHYSELEEVLGQADLFHFHMIADEDLALGPLRVREFLRGQPIIHHHHGEPPFRAEPQRFVEQEMALGRRAIVSTPDLLKLYPKATWLPNAVPLMGRDYLPDERLRGDGESDGATVVAHSPTRRELKNTAEFEQVVAALQSEGLSLRAEIIENCPHLECLRLKRGCDIFFDHMQGYFGVSSLEALSQGVPTVAGLDAWNIEQISGFAGCTELPWVIARNADELKETLADLSEDAGRRVELGRRSRDWMERHWSEAAIANRLSGFYAGH